MVELYTNRPTLPPLNCLLLFVLSTGSSDATKTRSRSRCSPMRTTGTLAMSRLSCRAPITSISGAHCYFGAPAIHNLYGYFQTT